LLIESIAFALAGLLVGALALTLRPEYFPPSRSLTYGTALVAALLSGFVGHYALGGALPAVAVAISATGSALLTSVLARPDQAGGRRSARRGRRAGSHRRHRHA
jgi:hypothetical protein